MLNKLSLRKRIILSYAVFGSVIGLVMYAYLDISYESLEEKLLVEHLEDEMEFFVRWVKDNPESNELKTKRLTGYWLRGEEKLQQFEFLNQTSPGVREKKYQGRNYIIKIAHIDQYRYYLIYDITSFEETEHRLSAVFAVCVLVTLLAAVWYGYSLSGKVIFPVKHLAKKIESLEPDDLTSRVSSLFADDEVGSLARSFDAYLQRMSAFVEREHNFVSDASHELRTPLAIIQGASEMLLSSTSVQERDKDRLQRIHRAVKTMGRGIEALLILARESSEASYVQGGISVADVLNDVVETCGELIDRSRLNINLNIKAEPELAAPDAIISLLITNLVQNAIRYTNEGKIDVTLEANRLIVQDTGVGIAENDLHKIFERGYRGKNVSADGSGLGLSLVKRICDYYAWQITVTSDEGEGVAVTWTFAE